MIRRRLATLRSLILTVLISVTLAAQPTHAQTPPPAFPGAEGFGAVATGGRGGQVIYVTTLANDGPGSLSGALRTPGRRYILFTVSGVINTAAELIYGDVTIAGQTSPGGITVRGIVCDGHYEANACDNLIIRHLRSRPAAHIPRDGAGYILDDALRLDGVEKVIVDHLSLANANDEAVQISIARNITIQNTIIAETVGEHHIFGGMLINYSHSQRPQDNLTIHHNLWHRITGRLPEISCEMTRNIGADENAERPSFCGKQPLNLELTNNLLWDAGGVITYNSNAQEGSGQPEAGLFRLHLNWVRNVMFVRQDYPFGMIGSDVTTTAQNRLFFEGNRMNLYPDLRDAQLASCCNDFYQEHPNTDSPLAIMLAERQPFPPVTLTETTDLPAYMVAQVGAFPRDPMDRRLLSAVANCTIDPESRDKPVRDDAFLLDYDPHTPPTAPLDTDLDGMPDAWETAHGLKPTIQDHNGNDLSEKKTGVAGYTNLEVYLNELADSLAGKGGTVVTGTPCSP